MCTNNLSLDHNYSLCSESLLTDMTTCPTCGVWVSRVRLDHHIERQHTRNYTNRQFQCKQCGKPSQSREAIEIHISKYHKGFSPLNNINDTNKISIKREKISSFPFCQSKSMERRRKCEKCGLKLSTKQSLEWHHRRVHTKTSLFCPKCLSYYPKGHLKRKHPEISHDTSLYKCGLCDKQFLNQLDNLNHQEKHHSCNICNTIFSTKKGIEAHMKENHKEIKKIVVVRESDIPEDNSIGGNETVEKRELYPNHLCGKCGSFYKTLKLHKQVCLGYCGTRL